MQKEYFNKEVKIIRNEFIKVDYPEAFTNKVIKQFNQDQLHNEITEEDEPLIPPYFLILIKPFHLLYLYHIVKRMRPNVRILLKILMSLPTRISELQLVEKQGKLVLCFH